jgi:hypothetical protein
VVAVDVYCTYMHCTKSFMGGRDIMVVGMMRCMGTGTTAFLVLRLHGIMDWKDELGPDGVYGWARSGRWRGLSLLPREQTWTTTASERDRTGCIISGRRGTGYSYHSYYIDIAQSKAAAQGILEARRFGADHGLGFGLVFFGLRGEGRPAQLLLAIFYLLPGRNISM